MALISLLRRERTHRVLAPGNVREVVAVTYSTPAVPPRTVDLPLEHYRPATPEELEANPRYQMLPATEEAAEAEREEIRRDVKAAIGPVPETFDAL